MWEACTPTEHLRVFVCVCVGALRGTQHWFTLKQSEEVNVTITMLNMKKGTETANLQFTQGHIADLLVTLLEFKAGLFNPGVCDPYNLVFWEKLGWKAADSCFLLD